MNLLFIRRTRRRAAGILVLAAGLLAALCLGYFGAGLGSAAPQSQEPATTQRGRGLARAQGTSTTLRGRGRRGGVTYRGPRVGSSRPLEGTPYPRDYQIAPSEASQIVARLDLDHFKANIKKLSSFPTRYWSTTGNEQARDWIAGELTADGYEAQRLKFTATGRPQLPEPAKEVEDIYVTKIGTKHPEQMYIISGHMDSYNTQSDDQSFAPGANDDGSGSSLVMEIARVFASPDVQTDVSVRFCLWNCEEIGLDGAKAYVAQRKDLQGKEDAPGSGKYPEPKWLGMIQHDMMLFDHGMPLSPTTSTVALRQIRDANVNIEYDAKETANGGAISLAAKWLDANMRFAKDYPAAVGAFMQNTDSEPFAPLVPAISLRENERRDQIGKGSDPQWHKNSDVYTTYSDADFELGFNAMQMTCGAIAELTGARVVGK